MHLAGSFLCESLRADFTLKGTLPSVYPFMAHNILLTMESLITEGTRKSASSGVVRLVGLVLVVVHEHFATILTENGQRTRALDCTTRDTFVNYFTGTTAEGGSLRAPRASFVRSCFVYSRGQRGTRIIQRPGQGCLGFYRRMGRDIMGHLRVCLRGTSGD